MAHTMYNANRTALITGDVMQAGRAQARRMLDGSAALRVADANLAAARASRAATLDRLAYAEAGLVSAQDRLARARAARAAFGARS